MIKKVINLELTIPPSLNVAFAWYPIRHKSNAYKKWEQLAGLELKKQEQYEITGDKWLYAEYTYLQPLFYKNGKKKKQDIDNYAKILTDFLVKQIPWLKDEHIKQMHLHKEDSKNLKVIVKIYELD
jgi:Holliday junction resolvase RusA-like endonuclease